MPVLKREYNFIGKAKRMNSKYLVVNQSGAYIVLAVKEYHALLTHKMSDELYSRLVSNNIIITNDNYESVVEDYSLRKAIVFQGASLHIVIPTLRCNQKCIYCHAASVPDNAKGYDMDKETATKFVDFVFQSPSNAITIEFQGGEPLLNIPIIEHIVEYARERNKELKKKLQFTIVTNLTLMTDEILDYLYKNRLGICTSLDGPKKVHDNNRKYLGGRGSYEDVVKWISAIRDKKRGRVNALTTITKFSLPHAKAIVDEYQKHNIKSIWFRFLNNLGDAKKSWKNVGYTAEEFISFWKEGVDYVFSKDMRKNKMIEISLLLMAKKILDKKDPMFLDLMSPCGAAIGQLSYMYDGSIYSCDEGRMVGDEVFKLGNVHEDTYKGIFLKPKTSSLVASSVNDTYLCDACIYQPYCGICPVLNYMNTQNIVPKLAEDFRCRILKAQFDHVFQKIISEEGFKEYISKMRVFDTPLVEKSILQE